MKNSIRIIQIKFLSVLLLTVMLNGCSDYLDVEPKGVVSPTNVKQLGQLVVGNLRYRFSARSTTMMNDDFTADQNVYGTFLKIHQNGYRWLTVYEAGDTDLDWRDIYETIYTANYVLDLIDDANLDGELEATRNKVKAEALTIRGYAYLQLVNIYGMHYNSSTAASDMAVPLLLTPDIEAELPRSSVEDIYNQIESDLLNAVDLYPNNFVSDVRSEGTKPATFGLLSRIYLYKGEWDKALNYATLTLGSYNTLYDYNNYSRLSSDEVKRASSTENEESVFYRSGTQSYSRGSNVMTLTSDLKNLFENNDLRFSFFVALDDGSYIFAPVDANNTFPINGIQTPELYLIKAECNARLGNSEEAMNDLAILRANRFDRDAYNSASEFEDAIRLSPSNKEEAIQFVTEERQRELMFTGLRWFDMKRLIVQGEYSPTIKRTASGQTYSLQIGTDQWVVDISPDIKAFNPQL